MSPTIEVSGAAGRTLQQQRVDEGLREVATELPLQDVELLGEQTRRPARGSISLEPTCRLDVIALLCVRERDDEAAEKEGAFGLAEPSFVEPVSVGVAVLGQLVLDGAERGDRPRIVVGNCTSDCGQEKRNVDSLVVG